MKIDRVLILIVGVALALRLIALAIVAHPGIADPTHYFNMAHRLIDGHGFTIDYLWQYNLPPESIVHPEEHWMPLTAVIAAAGIAVFGDTPRAAIAPFALLGALLPLVSYALARQMQLARGTAHFAALMTAVLPEMLLYSARTDTLVPSALCVGGAVLGVSAALRRKRLDGRAVGLTIASGLFVGLAYLTRTDGVLVIPMAIVLAIGVVLFGGVRVGRAIAIVTILIGAFALTIAPWIARNLSAFGLAGSPETADMFFFTDNLDHYAYGRTFTLQTMLGAATPAQLISKRAFEFAAAVKTMIVSLDLVLPIAVIGGLALVWLLRREPDGRSRVLAVAPVVILCLGILIAYPILIPFKSQSGSFKKAYLSILPLIVPIGAFAIERAIADVNVRRFAMIATAALAAAFAIDAVRLDASFTNAYAASVEQAATAARALPDTNDDGAIILMAQDPFMLRYAGIQSVMYPYEPLDTLIEVARRYGVDYLLMPADRWPLVELQNGTASDPRLTPAGNVPGTSFSFLAVQP